MKKNLLRYDQFIKENAPGIVRKPGETTTPAPTTPPKPAPARPSIIPTERPSEEDDPMAEYDVEYNQPTTKPTTTPAPTVPKPAPARPSIIPTERPSEEDEPMAEYDEPASLDNLYDMFGDTPDGAELMDNVLKYKGIEVEVPSETGRYMVNGRDLKTKDAQKAYDYVQAQIDPEEQAYAGQNELVESKSYSKTRKFTKRTKK